MSPHLATALASALAASVAWTVTGRPPVRGRMPVRRRRRTVPAVATRALERADVPDPERLAARWLLVLGVVTAAAVVEPGARPAALAVGVGAPAALLLVGDRAGRRRAAQLPDALDAVAAGVRGGLSLRDAIAGAATIGAPVGPELAKVAADAERGEQLVDSLERWVDTHPDADTRAAGAALRACATLGGPSARAVDAAAAGLRQRQATAAEIAGLAVQGRASALVLTAAPVVFATLLGGIDPRSGAFLTGTPVGLLCLVAGLTLDGLGAWWMNRLVRRVA